MAPEISTVAVLGAGTMGRGIAHVSALAGYTTYLYDPFPEALKKAESTIHRNLAKGVALGKVKAEDADRARAGLRTAERPRRGAVPGGRPGHRGGARGHGAQDPRLFSGGRANCPAHALLPRTPRRCRSPRWPPPPAGRTRFAGMHFFNPVHVMKLIELVRGLETSRETLAAMRPGGRAHGQGDRRRQRVAGLRHQPDQRADRQRGVPHARGRRGVAPRTSTRR